MKHQAASTYSVLDVIMASPTEPMPQEKARHQLTAMWAALAAIEAGEQPTTNDWRLLSDAVNLTETMVREMHVAEDSAGLLDDAVIALAGAGRRHRAGMPIRLDGPGINAVRAVLEDYASLVEQLSARTVITAHRLTEKRIRQILAGKRQPHDIEVVDL